jgi:drug/metabolite transporter (DMT)-like permease
LAAPSPTGTARLAVAPPSQRAVTGLLFALLAFFLFASSDAITKTLAQRYSIFQIIPMQVTFAAIPLALMVLRHGGLFALRPVHPRLVAARGLMAGVGTVFGYYAFSTLPLADVYAIVFCVPILVTVLSIPVLGERVGIHRWSAVIVGFVGILIMVRPTGSSLSFGHFCAFLAACNGAGVTLILRKVARHEHPPAMVLAVVLGLFVVSAPVALFVSRLPSLDDLGLVALSGLLIGTAQFVMLQAFRRATAASVAPMQYTTMVWAIVYGMVLFGDHVQPVLLAGAAIVIASSLYIMHRERRAGST